MLLIHPQQIHRQKNQRSFELQVTTGKYLINCNKKYDHVRIIGKGQEADRQTLFLEDGRMEGHYLSSIEVMNGAVCIPSYCMKKRVSRMQISIMRVDIVGVLHS